MKANIAIKVTVDEIKGTLPFVVEKVNLLIKKGSVPYFVSGIPQATLSVIEHDKVSLGLKREIATL